MYGVSIPKNHDIRKVVLGLDQLKCWQRLLGEMINIRQKITSPFRPDGTPGCYLDENRGIIRFKDFQQRVLHNADIVEAYARLYNCSMPIAAALLESDSFPPRNHVAIKIGDYYQPRRSGDRAVIQIQPFLFNGDPVFTKKHMAYWDERKISYETLQGWKNHQVLAVHSWSLDGDWQTCQHITFAYKFSNSNAKLYVPGRGTHKFPANNASPEDIWRWEKPGNTKLIVDKSFKDGCHNVRLWPDYDVWVFQSENTIASNIPDFSKYEKIVLKVDNDKAGTKCLSKLLTIFEDGLPMYYPQYVKGVKIKDTDDMVMRNFEEIAKKLMP